MQMSLIKSRAARRSVWAAFWFWPGPKCPVLEMCAAPFANHDGAGFRKLGGLNDSRKSGKLLIKCH